MLQAAAVLFLIMTSQKVMKMILHLIKPPVHTEGRLIIISAHFLSSHKTRDLSSSTKMLMTLIRRVFVCVLD